MLAQGSVVSRGYLTQRLRVLPLSAKRVLFCHHVGARISRVWRLPDSTTPSPPLVCKKGPVLSPCWRKDQSCLETLILLIGSLRRPSANLSTHVFQTEAKKDVSLCRLKEVKL
ncbi:uncharacterized protein [Magallana gigas]|uniref:uncharacterized protein n=1 Tax=Magallana gigas TaxID=29159 RepID=UPI00333FA2EB